MPALFTTTSIRPKWFTASSMMETEPAGSATLAELTRPRPPALVISPTTSAAGPASAFSPSAETPKSLTTTAAPSRAQSKAISRPMPRPAPVTATTLPSSMPASATHSLLMISPAV